jgi:hypothetical protein
MHPYFTTSFADREMFAYNSQREKQGADEQTRKKCFDKIAEYSAQLDYSEAHF